MQGCLVHTTTEKWEDTDTEMDEEKFCLNIKVINSDTDK